MIRYNVRTFEEAQKRDKRKTLILSKLFHVTNFWEKKFCSTKGNKDIKKNWAKRI